MVCPGFDGRDLVAPLLEYRNGTIVESSLQLDLLARITPESGCFDGRPRGHAEYQVVQGNLKERLRLSVSSWSAQCESHFISSLSQNGGEGVEGSLPGGNLVRMPFLQRHEGGPVVKENSCFGMEEA